MSRIKPLVTLTFKASPNESLLIDTGMLRFPYVDIISVVGRYGGSFKLNSNNNFLSFCQKPTATYRISLAVSL